MECASYISINWLIAALLCFWRIELAGSAEATIEGAGVSDDSSQSHFFYQQSEYPRDCRSVSSGCSASNTSGVFVIKPDGYPEPFDAFCDFSDGGWMVIHRRVDGSVEFDRLWKDYQEGFGFLSNNYWIGNDRLSYITNQAVYELRIDIVLSNGSSFYATYSGFRISDEWDSYKIVAVDEFASVGDSALTFCPRNMVYGNCSCRGTCEDPDSCAPTDCEQEIGVCVCPVGFLMDGDDCVPPRECPCYWLEEAKVIPNNNWFVNNDCTERRSCTNNRLVRDSDYGCDANARCVLTDNQQQCSCNEGYQGDGQDCDSVALYTNCLDVYNAGHTQDGIYSVVPSGWSGPPFNVSCVMDNGGGWTVFQRRTGNNRGTNFYLGWRDYKEGFGSLSGDFWLGNEKLHHLTSQGRYKMRVDMVTSGNSAKYGEYTSFATAGENDDYRLSISGHSGDTNDGMNWANGEAFSTHDRDNDGCGRHNCAANHRGAWWYSNYRCEYNYYYSYRYCNFFNSGGRYTLCTASNPNGDYNGGNGENINWYYADNCNLVSIEMKIRPNA